MLDFFSLKPFSLSSWQPLDDQTPEALFRWCPMVLDLPGRLVPARGLHNAQLCPPPNALTAQPHSVLQVCPLLSLKGLRVGP